MAGHNSVTIRVLTWNLFHGRSQPPAGRPLLEEFAARIASWEWDVALLQEVPPWWPRTLALAADAQQRTALTSRNALLPLRRAIADRSPDLIKSNGGGSNAILVRGPIADARKLMLRRRPERRVAQIVRLGCDACVANYHGSARVPLATDELTRLVAVAADCAHGAPLVVGGDLNLRSPDAPALGLIAAAGHSVDHVLVRGFEPVADQAFPDRSLELDGSTVELSDHRALLVTLRSLGAGWAPTG